MDECLLCARPLLRTGNSKANNGTFCPHGTSHQVGTRNTGTPLEKDSQLLHPPSLPSPDLPPNSPWPPNTGTSTTHSGHGLLCFRLRATAELAPQLPGPAPLSQGLGRGSSSGNLLHLLLGQKTPTGQSSSAADSAATRPEGEMTRRIVRGQSSWRAEGQGGHISVCRAHRVAGTCSRPPG